MTATLTPRARRAPPPVAAVTRAPRDAGDAIANAALVLLSLAAAFDLARLVRPAPRFLLPVVVTTFTVHGVAWASRRTGRGLVFSAACALWIAFLVCAWLLFPKATYYGLPVRHTFTTMGHSLADAARAFRTVVPPARSSPGFALAGAAGCACAALLSDWAAFRLRTTIEACLPSMTLFVFSAALAQGHGSAAATGAWLLAFLVFLLVRQAGVELPTAAWFAGRRAAGEVAVLQVGALLATIATLCAAVIIPLFIGSSTPALWDWRHNNPGPAGRTTGSPLVDIKSRLLEHSDTEVFAVHANRPAYWRLTSLDNFDGTGWSLNDSYRRAKGSLAGQAAGGPQVTAHFTIGNLQSLWLPAPYRPVGYRGPSKVSYSDESASLIADNATSDGLTYEADAVEPVPPVSQLRRAGPVDAAARAKDLALPALPALVIATVHDVTDTATTEYDKALALQNWFRSNFTYDLSVPPEDGENAIVSFLQRRRGFCQQFAGTYAAMARLIGIPARVAVGFTPGDRAADGLFHVKNLHAHAWPELYFPGLGWVPFEPTPGRGAADDQSYTGVAPAQNDEPAPAMPSATPPRGTGGPTTTAPPAAATPPSTVAPANPAPRSPHPSAVLHALATVIEWSWPLLLLGVTPLVSGIRRRQRRQRAHTAMQQVLLSWDESSEQFGRLGCVRRATDTPSEYADRTRSHVAAGLPALQAMARLAGTVETASYSAGGASATQAEAAQAAAAEIELAVHDAQPLVARLLRAIDPRSLWRTTSSWSTGGADAPDGAADVKVEVGASAR